LVETKRLCADIPRVKQLVLLLNTYIYIIFRENSSDDTRCNHLVSNPGFD